ncbi:unnamed protein product, partial [Nesidiocoris tenuis]
MYLFPTVITSGLIFENYSKKYNHVPCRPVFPATKIEQLELIFPKRRSPLQPGQETSNL